MIIQGKGKLTAILVITLLTFWGCGSMQNDTTGFFEGEFHPCPGSPNCVSSMDVGADSYIKPFTYTSLSRQEAFDHLLGLLEKTRRCRIMTAEEAYIHAEFRSRLFRFVDDVEFFLPEQNKLVHIRSASRLGYSDFGVNRKRMEELRSLFEGE